MLSGFQNGSSICIAFVDSASKLLGAKWGIFDAEKTFGTYESDLTQGGRRNQRRLANEGVQSHLLGALGKTDILPRRFRQNPLRRESSS
jgi:hypothetical protein